MHVHMSPQGNANTSLSSLHHAHRWLFLLTNSGGGLARSITIGCSVLLDDSFEVLSAFHVLLHLFLYCIFRGWVLVIFAMDLKLLQAFHVVFKSLLILVIAIQLHSLLDVLCWEPKNYLSQTGQQWGSVYAILLQIDTD